MEKTVISPAKIKAYTAKGFKLLIVLIVLGLMLAFWLGEDKPIQTEKLNDKSPIYDLTKAIDDKSLWLFKAQNQLSEQQGKQEKLSQELEELKKSVNSVDEISHLKNRIEQLEQKAVSENAYSPQTELEAQESFEAYAPSSQDSDNEAALTTALSPISQNPLTSGIFSESLNLSSTSQSKLPHKDSFIPPGTYTKAILLNGIDVSAGVSSQASPKPVLLRLVNKGSLPNKAFGHLKDCRIIAAAFGDLSSERAYMRLEKLSCVQPNGEVIVTDVDGYVSGEDGKNGLRGRVVIRDAAVLARGLMGGLLSGLGKASTQSYRSTSVSPFGAVDVSSAKGLDIFKQAGSQGMGDAFELLAKYNIQRAEQYQPIIQISAGREVDVVFHSGSQFGEKKVRAPLKEPTPQNNNPPTQSAYGE